MDVKIIKRQHTSDECFVCGVKNEGGLQAKFYELEGQQVMGVFTPRDVHQGYPGRLHGGVAASILDETIGRVMFVQKSETWGVTVELTTKYKKPVPLNEEVKVIARAISNTEKIFEGEAELYLSTGEVAVTAYAKYVKLNLGKIVDNAEGINDIMHLEEDDVKGTVTLP